MISDEMSRENSLLWMMGIMSVMLVCSLIMTFTSFKDINTISRSFDRLQTLIEVHEKEIMHLRQHADTTESMARAITAGQGDILRRITEVEGNLMNQPQAFTKRDGDELMSKFQAMLIRLERLEERINPIIAKEKQK